MPLPSHVIEVQDALQRAVDAQKQSATHAPRVTEIHVRESITHNLGDYSNYRPSLAVTVAIPEGGDWREIERATRGELTERLQELVDDELERRGDRPFYAKETYRILYNEGAGYVIAIASDDKQPRKIDPDYGAYSQPVSLIRRNSVDERGAEIAVEKGLLYLGVLSSAEYAAALPILHKIIYSDTAKAVFVCGAGQTPPSSTVFSYYYQHASDLLPADAYEKAEQLATKNGYTLVGVVADAHYADMLPSMVRVVKYNDEKIALILPADQDTPSRNVFGWSDTRMDLMPYADALTHTQELGEMWTIHDSPTAEEYPTVLASLLKKDEGGDDYEDDDDYDEDYD